jgi:glycosyltransferase involved in cell wall biosynthesis
LLVASEAAGLAEAIGALLADPVVATQLGERGHTFVQSTYDWAATTADLEHLLMG